ncbi:F-box domain-containing protein [Entamoeba marina]
MDICTKDNNVHLTIEHTRNVDSTKIVITEMLNDEKMEVQQLLKEYNKEVQGSNEEKIKKYGEMCTELNGLVEKKKVEVQNMKNGSLSFLETQYEKDFILETKELHVDVLSTCESQLRKKLDKLISSRPPKLPTLPILPEKDNKKSLSDINPAEIPFFHFTAITVQPKTFKIKEKAMSEQRAAEMKSYEVAKSQTKSSGHSKINDIFNFICICKKCKEVIQTVFINPYSIVLPIPKLLQWFPRIQTFHMENTITQNNFPKNNNIKCIDCAEKSFQLTYEMNYLFTPWYSNRITKLILHDHQPISLFIQNINNFTQLSYLQIENGFPIHLFDELMQLPSLKVLVLSVDLELLYCIVKTYKKYNRITLSIICKVYKQLKHKQFLEHSNDTEMNTILMNIPSIFQIYFMYFNTKYNNISIVNPFDYNSISNNYYKQMIINVIGDVLFTHTKRILFITKNVSLHYIELHNCSSLILPQQLQIIKTTGNIDLLIPNSVTTIEMNSTTIEYCSIHLQNLNAFSYQGKQPTTNPIKFNYHNKTYKNSLCILEHMKEVSIKFDSESPFTIVFVNNTKPSLNSFQQFEYFKQNYILIKGIDSINSNIELISIPVKKVILEDIKVNKLYIQGSKELKVIIKSCSFQQVILENIHTFHAMSGHIHSLQSKNVTNIKGCTKVLLNSSEAITT